jgi:hypothetical protein
MHADSDASARVEICLEEFMTAYQQAQAGAAAALVNQLHDCTKA